MEKPKRESKFEGAQLGPTNKWPRRIGKEELRQESGVEWKNPSENQYFGLRGFGELQAGSGVEWKNPSKNQCFEVRGFVAVSMGCWRETALNGKTQARIKVLRCEALLRFRWAAGGKRR